MNLQDAMAYINCSIKYGFYSPEQFEGWSDKKLIDFAEEESARGEMYADYLETIKEGGE